MCDCRCYIVPPYLLRSISDSQHNPPAVREAARAALTRQSTASTCRHDHTKALLKEQRGWKSKVLWGRVRKRRSQGTPKVVSVGLLRHIVESENVDERVKERARRDLTAAKQKYIVKSGTKPASDEVRPHPAEDRTFYRAIYDAKNSNFEFSLPGTVARVEGERPVDDKAVNESYDNVGQVLQMFKDFFDWTSIDNENSHIISTVHFGDRYENAYWDPDKMQLVFGDGDEFLKNFTGTVDVIGHELTHAVTDNISPLLYYGQSGALNEHISDVFGIIVKQRKEKEDAASADWLIGEGCLVPGVKGIALRSMKAPGTAYDDPRFGKDPQPDHFKYYEDTYEDNGGVHIYSGIPNKAFYLIAKEFGGYSWQRAGKIWWDTLQSDSLSPDTNFIGFANATVSTARKTFDDEAAKIVEKGWKEVGVIPDGGAAESGSSWMDRIMDSCNPF
ncbi:related to extracellular metalloproteinase [Cephalotrichum gorgonifer]|uniref:Related to extracellular metalloproteinase n=1 Tax=Cephalotrichum gorgonifer TaxID=2041049 RepID=A0AAE8N1V5_9PEZI|nr:related to extracellular metalloproteinase [Cephalotrichum gorgonifer]